MRTFLKFIIVYILIWEAKRALKKWKPFIVLVSGSVGKTTTKDAIYHVLKDSTDVRKSEKSFNTELGVPLTVLGLENAWRNPFAWLRNIIDGYHVTNLPSYPKLLILEVGSDHPGDIAKLTKWLTPDIAVITRLPEVPVHVEYFDSPESLRKEDALIVSALKEGGVYIANADDVHSRALIKETSARNIRSISYGFERSATIHATKLTVRYAKNGGEEGPVGMQFDVRWEKEKFPVYITGVIGVQVSTAVLAALAVGVARGVSMLRMTEALYTFEAPRGRMRIIGGKFGSTIIDDTYNSSPVALEVALNTLKELKGKRKIAILGDMLELGAYAHDEHWKAGMYASTFLDELITVGVRAEWIAEAAKSAGLAENHIHIATDSIAAGKIMLEMLKGGDIILAKGSQGTGENMIRIERAVKMLMADEGDAKNVLVRQEEEWQKQYK